jgi:anti-sigma regulatory factor (Ser/Thr protein kinase)
MPAEVTRASKPITDPALLTHWLVLGSITLPGQPQQVSAARKFVASTIGACHAQADTALLLTSELVTNAVTHSSSRLPGGTVDVVVAARPAGLLISVTDDGSADQVPVLSNKPGAANGNGLLLVASLADAWGHSDESGRTVVWFRLARCSPEPDRPGARWQDSPRVPTRAASAM